jgi:hypothetical protein
MRLLGGGDRYSLRSKNEMKHQTNTQLRIGGAGPMASRTPTLSEGNFALQRALARREMIERKKWAARQRNRARWEVVVGPVRRAEAAVAGKAGQALARGKGRMAGFCRGTVERAQRGLRELIEHRV